MKPIESALRVLPFLSARWSSRFWVAGLVLAGLPGPAWAQDLKRAQATRAELQATLTELQQYMASSGYSSRLRDEKRREAEMVRSRLEDGDLQVGDSLDLTVQGEKDYSGGFMVGTGRMLSLPGLPDIPLKGVLRSEAQDYLKGQLSKYIRDPQVHVRTMIRLSVFGSVGKPGFFQVPADVSATDAFMRAGGPSGDADPNRVWIKRGGNVIWSQEAFRDAMQQGLTLDQLNLRAGDELYFDPRKRPGGISLFSVVGAISAVSSVVFLFIQIF